MIYRILLIAILASFGRTLARADTMESAADFARAGMGMSVKHQAIKQMSHVTDNHASVRHPGTRYVLASWYGGGERLNRHTANGERFNPHALTAAHRTLPMGARIVVAYAGREVMVRVNDRGPAKWTGRELDLSRAAAKALGYEGRGEARVRYWRVG